jgi:hypothetical protein
MAIKGPKGATATLKGWVSPKGELLKAQKMTQAQVDEANGVKAKPAPAPAPEVIVEAEPVVEETQELLIEDVAEPEEAPEIVAAPKARPVRKTLAERIRSKVNK